jgi:hypothetical protein
VLEAGHRQQEGKDVNDGKAHLRDRLLTGMDDLLALPAAEPLIDGLVFRNTLGQLSGLPGCLKSFLAISMACSLAAGRNLGSFAVPKPATVVYVAAEGANGLAVRIAAWCDKWDVDPVTVFERLHILPLPIQLGDEDDMLQITELVGELVAGLLFIDTRHRCTVGLEENSATEQGRAIEAVESIRLATECSVMPLHHTPRTGGAGRGSNAWDGDVWSDLRMTRDGMRAKIHCEKHKDAPDGCDHHFNFRRHAVPEALMPGRSEKERTTLVLTGAGSSAGIFDLLPHSRQVVLEIIRNSAPEDGFTAPKIVRLAVAAGVSESSAYAALKEMREQGLIRNIGSDKRPRYVAADNPS